MKTHRILKSFDALPQDTNEWRVEQDQLEAEQTRRKMAEGLEPQPGSSPGEFAPLQPCRRMGNPRVR